MMKEMRRQDRKLSEEEALAILNEAEYGVLSTITPDGVPYGLPINFALDGNCIYMHCATGVGQKLDNIAHCPMACMTAVVGVELHSRELSTAFRSAMAFGPVTIYETPEAKRIGLRALVHRLAPEYGDRDPDCMDEVPLARVGVLKMEIQSISGKFHL